MLYTIKSTLNYIKFWFKASNSKGHGTHSPFVFNFIIHVLNDKRLFYCYKETEIYRNKLIKENGFQKAFINQLNKPKIDKLLFRIVNYYGLNNIALIGLNEAITPIYIANANTNAQAILFENDADKRKYLQENIALLQVKNIEVSCSNLASNILNNTLKYNLIYCNNVAIDDVVLNHFFNAAQENAFIIYNKIYTNLQTEIAWQNILQYPATFISIDLYNVGIIVMNSNIKTKQHFKIRY